jgi:hypothetical protein
MAASPFLLTIQKLYKMDTRLSQIIAGGTGGQLISSGGAITGSFSALVVNEDCVIAAILVDGVDVTAARGFALKTITAGMFIGCGLNQSTSTGWPKITSINLTSGSVMAY